MNCYLIPPTNKKGADYQVCALLFLGSGGWIRKETYVGHCLGIDTHLIDAYNELMRIHFKPTTKLGRCSAWLIVAFAVFFGSLQALIASGQRGGDTFFSNLVLAIPGLLAATSGIVAFVTGLISITKRKERAVAVYLAVAIGFVVLTFVIGEIAFPH